MGVTKEQAVQNRERILEAAERLFREKGVDAVGLAELMKEAGFTRGGFYNHFASKEAFCLEVLDRYFEDTRATIGRTLRNDSVAPLKRLRAYLDAQSKYLNKIGLRNGCLIGNFSAEASEHSEVIRKRIVEIFEEMRQAVAYCLRAAVKTGALPRKTDCDELAGFLNASMQGAILQAKAERSAVAIERFKHLIFSTLLR